LPDVTLIISSPSTQNARDQEHISSIVIHYLHRFHFLSFDKKDAEVRQKTTIYTTDGTAACVATGMLFILPSPAAPPRATAAPSAPTPATLSPSFYCRRRAFAAMFDMTPYTLLIF